MFPLLSIQNLACRLPKPEIRIFPTLAPQHWAIYIDGGTRLADGETLARWSAVVRSHHGRIYVMFVSVITTEAHLAYEGARVHSNYTAEMSAIIEALSFLGLWPSCPWCVLLCFFCYSKHAAGVCVGTIHARTYSLDSCQQLLLKV